MCVRCCVHLCVFVCSAARSVGRRWNYDTKPTSNFNNGKNKQGHACRAQQRPTFQNFVRNHKFVRMVDIMQRQRSLTVKGSTTKKVWRCTSTTMKEGNCLCVCVFVRAVFKNLLSFVATFAYQFSRRVAMNQPTNQRQHKCSQETDPFGWLMCETIFAAQVY